MIAKYDDFLLERIMIMINESQVVYSEEFKKLLSFIDSPVSKALNDAESRDIDVSNNYFDVSDSKDSISFITDKKAKQLLEEDSKYVIYKGKGRLSHNTEENGRLFDLLNYTPDGEKPFKPADNERGEIISKAESPLSGRTFVLVKFKDGQCVISREKVESDNSLKSVWSKSRQSIRVGRAIRALLKSTGDEFKDSDIEDFVNKYKSAFDRINDAFYNFHLVSGSDIGYWYSNRNYLRPDHGTVLSNSCMSEVNSSFFDIYMDNPNVCKLLVLKDKSDQSKIKGRALVWNLYRPNITYMDRVYTHDDSDVNLFKEYARSKGWYHKIEMNSSPDTTIMTPQNTPENFSELRVYVKSGDYDDYPYVDTLKYYYMDDGMLSTEQEIGYICLESTSGSYDSGECSYCDNSGEVDCSVCDGGGDVSCEECDGDGYNNCDDCGGEGTHECHDCEGAGEFDCPECDGVGKVDGEECEDCSGSGKLTCSNCNEGEVKCEECDGNGTMRCVNCDGNGTNECSNCEGTGKIDCEHCR
jgi:hypothetical protein